MFETAVQSVLEALKSGRILGRNCRASRSSLMSLVEGPRAQKEKTGQITGRLTGPLDVSAEMQRAPETLARREATPAPAENRSPGEERFLESPLLERAARVAAWEDLEARVAACRECPELTCSRNRPVRGCGDVESPVLFVEEAPSPGQDADGHIAAGDAAELFEKILKAMGLTREQVFVVHAVRCLPPRLAGDERHRKPLSEEVDACRAHLRELVRLIRPRVIVALGSLAARGILRTQEPVARLRSQWREWGGIPVMATFHPSYLIENKDLAIKRKVWEDLLQVMEKLEMPISAKQRGFFLK